MEPAERRYAGEYGRPETECPECGKMTHTVFGQCPNCGAAKEASRLPSSSPIPRGGFWSELDDLVAIGLIVAPITVLLVLGAVFVAPEIALVAVVLIVGYALLRQFFEIW